jgi:carbonic anhydrase
MNFSKIFNETVHSRKFIGYEGSLTTPPCTEMVNWHVLLEPEHITPAELSYLKTFMGTYGNAR